MKKTGMNKAEVIGLRLFTFQEISGMQREMRSLCKIINVLLVNFSRSGNANCPK